MAIAKGQELAVRPRVQDPVLDAEPAILGLILGLVPGVLDLGDEGIAGSLGRLLGLDALVLQVAGELLRVPLPVGRHDVRVPVRFHELLELLAVGGSRVGDVVVGKPPLELGFVPFVVCCGGSVSVHSSHAAGT